MKISPLTLEKIALNLCFKFQERKKPANKKPYTENELWFNLATSVLSSQVPYETALYFSKALKDEKLLCPPPENEHPAIYYMQVRSILKHGVPLGNKVKRYRFPEAKAKQLTKSRQNLLLSNQKLADFVYEKDCSLEKRKQLVSLVCGFGPKQASMFLRDVNAADNLAIIDTHTFDYMNIVGLLGSVKTMPTSQKAYLNIEQAFLKYAHYVGAKVTVLDEAIWQTMRTAKKENYI